MIDMRNRYYVTVAFRGIDGESRPELGSVVESNGILFSVNLSRPRWIAMIAVLKNKVEYLDCLKRFKQDTSIVITEWYPRSVFDNGHESFVYEKYEGNIVFVGSKEIISSHP